jgi:hypothetical protein
VELSGQILVGTIIGAILSGLALASVIWLATRQARTWQLACERADRLLATLLTPDQRDQLAQEGYVEVPSPATRGRTYQVRRPPARVRVYEDGVQVDSLCVQIAPASHGPGGPLPDSDVIVMHKLMIEANEHEYLQVANHRQAPTAAHAANRRASA